MKKILFLLFVISISQLQAQFRYTITSLPDSAAVYMNDELECYTPCRVKYYWRSAQNGKLVFSVKAENFEIWSDTLREKPHDFDKRKRVFLEKKYKIFDFKEAPLTDFDKLVIEFNNGEKIGEKVSLDGSKESINWKGSIKIGDESFREKFIETATNMGFNTIINESSQLFSDDNRKRQKLPRFIVGVEVKDYQVNYKQVKDKDYSAGDVKARTEMAFLWKVLDKKSGEVVYSYENRRGVNFRQHLYQSSEYYNIVYELAVIDFLQSDGFIDLIESSEDVFVKKQVDIKEVEFLNLTAVALPEFAQLSNMIQHANRASVTIVTDGGHGSGVVISKEGLLLSAYHVVEGVNQIDVKFSSGLTLKAEIVDYDKVNDVVLLDIQGEGFTPLPISTDDEFRLGAEVVTIGTPADIELGQSVSKGILSGKRKKENRIYWQVDMAVSPGNSGGPLLNEKGEVIGIIQSKIVEDGVEGIGFALPIAKVKEIFNIVLK